MAAKLSHQKVTPPKSTNLRTRPSISQSDLVKVPDDAVEGYQERIEAGIEWNIIEQAARHHKMEYSRPDLPKLSFSEALAEKIKHSYISGFLNDNTTLSIDDLYELIVPAEIWDNEKFASEQGKVMFMNKNCLTDSLYKLPKKAVTYKNKELINKDFKRLTLLRVNDVKMTRLDKNLLTFKNLVCLNLCGNYISKLDSAMLPRHLVMLELTNNAIENASFFDNLPPTLEYLGLSRNRFADGVHLSGLTKLPRSLSTLDLGDNDIYDLPAIVHLLNASPMLKSLTLAGNPCSVCNAYARVVIQYLPHLQWLDGCEIQPTDYVDNYIEINPIHPDDLRSAYFYFYVFRVMSVPPPPKIDKGYNQIFHVEFEIPLLDVQRRLFLMHRNNESLIEFTPPAEDEYLITSFSSKKSSMVIPNASKEIVGEEASVETNPYATLEPVNDREIIHYTVFKTASVSWNPLMTFPDPGVRIFCPDLFALRNTFRTVITAKLVYTQQSILTVSKKQSKLAVEGPPQEFQVVLATVKCNLEIPNWSQPYMHFHWDESFETDVAMHWGDGDLNLMQYASPTKDPKGTAAKPEKLWMPQNLTCHFGCGIETLYSDEINKVK